MQLPRTQGSSLVRKSRSLNRSLVESKRKYLLRLDTQSTAKPVVMVLLFGWNRQIELNSALASTSTATVQIHLLR